MGEPVMQLAPCIETRDEQHFTRSCVVGCGFQIAQRGYLVVGNHQLVGNSWHCLEDLQTGKRFDVIWQVFDEQLQRGHIRRLNEMEVLAWVAQ